MQPEGPMCPFSQHLHRQNRAPDASAAGHVGMCWPDTGAHVSACRPSFLYVVLQHVTHDQLLEQACMNTETSRWSARATPASPIITDAGQKMTQQPKHAATCALQLLVLDCSLRCCVSNELVPSMQLCLLHSPCCRPQGCQEAAP